MKSQTDNIVKLQSQDQTSVLGLGVDFDLLLSQQEQEQEHEQEQQEEPPSKSIRRGVFTLKTKSCPTKYLKEYIVAY